MLAKDINIWVKIGKSHIWQKHIWILPRICFCSQWNNRTWLFSNFRTADPYSYMYMFVSKQNVKCKFYILYIPSSFLIHCPPPTASINTMRKDIYGYYSCINALKYFFERQREKSLQHVLLQICLYMILSHNIIYIIYIVYMYIIMLCQLPATCWLILRNMSLGTCLFQVHVTLNYVQCIMAADIYWALMHKALLMFSLYCHC